MLFALLLAQLEIARTIGNCLSFLGYFMTKLPGFWSEYFAATQLLLRAKKFLLIFAFWMFLGFLMAVGVDAAKVTGTVLAASPPLEVVTPETQLENGKVLYQTGQFLSAASVWQTAAAGFESRGDIVNRALVLSYLALTDQQLGKPEAAATMDQAVALLATQKLSQSSFILAQILNNQGQLQLSQGKPEMALLTWQKSAALYRKIGDRLGEFGTQLNQARALQALGFYLRARTTLQQLEVSLISQEDSQLKVNQFLNLGNVLRISGDFKASQKILQQSLDIAEKLQLKFDLPGIWLGLGNLAEARSQPEAALKYYQQAASEQSPVRLQAELAQLGLLIELSSPQTPNSGGLEPSVSWQNREVQKLLISLQTQLANSPANQTTIYAKIELAKYLVKLDPNNTATAAKWLATAQKQAKAFGNSRAESYALGRLAGLYEQTQQWQEAKGLTQQALSLVLALRAPEIAYLWQWQMGRLLVKTAQGDYTEAIASYTEAFQSLQSLRQDLLATTQDVQLSFRESIEPVYRELVDLLLKNTAKMSPSQQQKHLGLARETLEALNLAELANFFREACLNDRPQSIEQVDATAAVIYPIILSDRLEVILSLPGQPLRHYATFVAQAEVEAVIKQMRQSLRRTSFEQERLPIAQQLYTWLIEPTRADLSRQSLQTLVFVLDGSLRNLPMAALYDGKQYLIEQYKIAIAPSLQLLTPRPLAQTQLKALVAGLTQGNQEFSALPGVQAEVNSISNTIPTTTLIDQQFTTTALEVKLKTRSFSVMHLATHGQFSSKPEETFILAWDRQIDFKQLNALLNQGDLSQKQPIELLVLSACQTAQGDQRAALGLAGVAVRSGARSTLATLWTVSDESTKEFMLQFYQTLLKPQVNKAEAVRLAQLYLLKQPEFRHPYYWAPFILVGNWL